MPLNLQGARDILTKTYTAVYNENIPAPSFLKTFFPSRVYPNATVNIEVRRGTEKKASDVLRGTRGNRNTSSRSTEKQYLAPFFKEYFDVTELDNYDRMFGASPETPSSAVLGLLGRAIGEEYNELRNKIERAKELMCAEVFETGVVTMINGDSIDFKRKSASLVDLGAAGYWSNVAADVENQLIAAGDFVRQKGKNGTSVFNLVVPGAAYVALKRTTFFKDNANYNNVNLNDIRMPQKDAFGAGYHGTISAGSYTFNIWTYDEGYEDESLNFIKYWPETKAFVVPVQGTRFELSHAAVPAIIRDTRNAEFTEFIGRISAEYYRTNRIDPNAMAHYFWLMSACVPVPITVDMIYTMQILGDGEVVVG